MASFFPAPAILEAQLIARVPPHFYSQKETEWLLPSTLRRCPIFLEGITPDSNGNLYVVDVPYGRVLRLKLPQSIFGRDDLEGGEWTLVGEWNGEPNGLVFDERGTLLVADYKEGILKLDPRSGTVRPFIARRNLEGFKGVNDLILASGGDLYFTDQGQTGLSDPTGRVHRLSPSGKLDTLIDNAISPNGLVLSPDEKTLFVAMTRDNSVWRCPLHTNGTTTKVNRFFQSFGTSGPDGLTIDVEGNLYICHPSLSCVFVVDPEGIPVARLIMPGGKKGMVTNCIFGGRKGVDRNVLYFLNATEGAVYAVARPCEGGVPIRNS